ncbi:MAG: allantoicase [Candidatus Acidiferrales bacterium]
MKGFTQLVDLASERLGGRVLEASDEFFAPKENLLKPAKPIFIEEKYTDRGKWMDGWETRRRRTPGYDWCVIRLGLAGIIRGAVVDTSFFRGNYPEQFLLEACDLGIAAPYKNERARLKSAATRWVEILPQAGLKGDSQNLFPIENPERFTHLRLKIFPDGGVARLRVHGEVVPDKNRISRGEIDLVAVENGGSVVDSSDQFFSAPLHLLMPGRGKNMGDGWETRRRRGPGNDWVIVKLGVPGTIGRIELDTAYFKGNFPESCSIEACYVEGPAAEALLSAASVWKTIVSRTKLKANHRHIFRRELNGAGAANHLRLQIYPDGGVSRLRIFGRAEKPGDRVKGVERFNHLSKAQARKALYDCCGSKKWVARMMAQKRFANMASLYEAADKILAQLDANDWLEAFRHHPAIGELKAKEKQSATARGWSAGEQSAAQKSSPETQATLAAANRSYQKKFGHVFLICATGKTSEEILSSLQQRLSNAPEAELRIAAEEQRKITRLRLEKLLES